jgi:DNA polymerase I-like protein with 3'-5' exonuclease and polymerase domains
MEKEEIAKRVLNSPLVSIDYETKGEYKWQSTSGYDAQTIGVSVGWIEAKDIKNIKPEDIKAEYFGIDRSSSAERYVRWGWFQENILAPIWNKPDVHLIMHNCGFDLQQSMRNMFEYPMPVEKVAGNMPKCIVDDTMVMAFLVNENYPRKLKKLAHLFLKKRRKTFKQTGDEMKSIDSEAKKQVKEKDKEGWNLYVEMGKNKHEKGQMDLFPIGIERRDRLGRIINRMPYGLSREEFSLQFLEFYGEEVLARANQKKARLFSKYGREDSTDPIALYLLFLAELKKRPETYNWYRKVEMPFAMLMVEMEMGGVFLDRKPLEHWKHDLENLIEERIQYASSFVAENYGLSEFNPRAHPQIKNLLWNKLKLKAPEWAEMTVDGPQSNKEVLEYLYTKHKLEICKQLVELNMTNKLYSTYVLPLFEQAATTTSFKVRTSYNPVGCVTGRVSSSNPNLQNIPNPIKMPVVTEEVLQRIIQGFGNRQCNGKPPYGWDEDIDMSGEKTGKYRMMPVRTAFVAPPGHKLLVADYSQIEMRTMAHYSRDPVLINIFQRWDCECGSSGTTSIAMHKCPKCGASDGKRDKTKKEQPVIKGFCLGLDAHTLTGMEMDLIDKYGYKQGRQFAKKTNFGLLYLKSAWSLQYDLDVDEHEAKRIHSRYFSVYARVRAFHNWVRQEFKRCGKFRLAFGNRWRQFTSQFLKYSKGKLKKFQLKKVQRDAVNNLPQGCAGDILKLGMLRYHWHKSRIPELRHTYFMLQVHDEVVVVCREEHVELCRKILVDSLENAAKLIVPILVNIEICDNWNEGK